MQVSSKGSDAEGDISESPLLSALNKDIAKIEMRIDNKLIIVLFLLVPLAYLYKYSGLKNVWLDVTCVLIVFGMIAIALFRNILKKRRIAETYGLVCGVCGHVPHAHMLLSAAAIQRCSKCGEQLQVALPK